MPLPLVTKIWTKTAAPALHRFVEQQRLIEQVRRERRALATLDERLLRDIGVTCEEARAEAGRDPWDVPDARKPGGTRHNGKKPFKPANLLLSIRPGG